MTEQIERCLCGGNTVVMDDRDSKTTVACQVCWYETPSFSNTEDAITLHNRMMRAAQTPETAQGIESMDLATLQAFAIEQAIQATAMRAQAGLAHQQLLDERQRWEEERAELLSADQKRKSQVDVYWGQCLELGIQLEAKQAELDTVIAAHKQQVRELTNALAPVEWEVGRVPTEPGKYWWQDGISPCIDQIVMRVEMIEGRLMCAWRGGFNTFDEWATICEGRWLGPVVLPRKRA